MLKPATPPDEAARLQALRSLDVLDTLAEERFDRLTRIAQHILQVPIALVSLIDAERQWFKSRQGLDAPETTREISFCGHAILGSEVFVVADAASDARFADNPLVLEAPSIRFYAGAPLTLSGGERVGTLCAIDRQPRQVSEQQLAALRDLARCVVDELERTRKALQAERAEAAARESAQFIKSIVDTVLDGIITIDSRGVVRSFNTAAERLFGHPAADVIGNNVKMLMPEPYAAEHDAYLTRYLGTGEARVIGIGREVVGRRKDGSTFPMELGVSEMPRADQSLFVGIVRDITERKAMERMKGEFLSTVSHELRTPLTSILGGLSLVIGKFAGSLPDRARQLLDTAKRNSERLTYLINDLLDLERLQSSRMDFEFKAIDLPALARQAIAANEGFGQQHDVRLKLTEAPAGALVMADEHRLLQVFANLISNAVKYSPAGGLVEVAVRRRDRQFRVTVRDFGRGIPAAFRERMFQRFAQADASDAREKGGTGLGLSIAKAIVERHGGGIDFEAAEGAGTEFFFELPEWQESIVPARDNRPLVLICEDNADVAMVLADLLDGADVTSDRAATAAAALEMTAAKRYRALLLDIGLPDMDGLDLLRRLRGIEASRDLPVIVVSGHSRSVAGNWQGQALSILDWIQKPVDPDRLGQALQAALARRTRRRILHVEDDLDVIQVTQALLEGDTDYHYATTLAQARQALLRGGFDLLLLDLTLPDGSGLDLLDAVGADAKVILFSGQEPGLDVTRNVAAALTKASTSSDKLLAAIRRVLDLPGD